MAQLQRKGVQLYSGVTAPTIVVQEAAVSAATWAEGDLLKFDGNGYVTLASAGYIAGIACADQIDTDYIDTVMELIMYDELYTICAQDGQPVARAVIGEGFELNFTTTAHYVTTTTTTPEVHIYGIYGGNDVTTNGERYIVRFYQPNIETG